MNRIDRYHATLQFLGRIFISTVAIALTGISVFAQNGERIQTGFAALRAVSGSAGSLMVTGSVAHRVGDEVFHSTTWAGSVTTATALVAKSDAPSGQDTGIAIVNASNFSATVTLTLMNEEGITVASRSLNIAALHQISRFVSELLNVQGTGLLFVKSTAPIALIGLQYYGSSFSLVPTNAPYGETALLLPQVTTGNGWSTQVVIANGGATLQTVRVDFYSSDGVILDTLPNVSVPPGGVTVINRQ